MTISPKISADPSPVGRARLVAGAIGLGAAAAALWWSGRAIPGPSTFDHQGVTNWLGTSDPLVAAFAFLRLAGLALVGWIALTGAIALVVHLSRLRRIRWLRRLVDRLCLPVVRRLVHAAAAGTLAAATLAPVTAGALVPTTTTLSAPTEVATLVALAPAGAQPTEPTEPTSSPAFGGSPDRAEIVALDPIPSSPAPPPAPAPAPDPPSPTPPTTTPGTTAGTASELVTGSTPRDASPSNAGNTEPDRGGHAGGHPDATGAPWRVWRIEPGQHLWHVAEKTMADALGAPPDDDAVAAYWAVVVEANRDRLVVPTDPDLVFAGQEILLPPVAARG